MTRFTSLLVHLQHGAVEVLRLRSGDEYGMVISLPPPSDQPEVTTRLDRSRAEHHPKCIAPMLYAPLEKLDGFRMLEPEEKLRLRKLLQK